MAKVQVAIAWLLKEDWPRWQKIDPELPPYDRWLTKINRAISEAESKGVVAEKVTVDPDTFARYCRATGQPVHRDTRARYAAEQLMRRGDMH